MSTDKFDSQGTAIVESSRQSSQMRPAFLAFCALTLAIVARSLVFVFAKFAALDTADSSLVAILHNPWYWGELVALGVQAFFWILALKHLDLTVAYSAMGMVFALTLVWAWFIFGETVTVFNIIGCGLIVAGVALGTIPSRRGQA